MTTPAICYHRFSSARQDKGSSLERQAALTRELCERKGWQIVETLEDKGQSAWKGDHLSVGNLGKLRTRIDAGLIARGTVVVVENLDRLSRQDYRTARRWIEDVTDAGVSIAVCSPDLFLDEPAMNGSNIGAMLQHLLEANRASAESRRKSQLQQRNVERMREQARAGIVFNPNSCRWLKGSTGGQFEVIEERAAIVRMIYEWCASGLGYQSICQRLNATVTPWTVSRSGRSHWQAGYVRDILRSPAVEGEYHVAVKEGRAKTGEIIRGYYPRVVEPELVAKARAAIASRTNNGGQGYGEARNLFTGLVKCDRCGGSVGRLVCGNGRGARYAYLACRNARYGSCDNKTKVRCDLVEAGVMDFMLHMALDSTHFVAVNDIAPVTARLAVARKRHDDLQHEQANLIRALRTLSTSEALLNELAQIERDVAANRAEIEDAERALEKAQGMVSPADHLKRVRDVRGAIASDGKEEREQARRMVQQAFAGVISSMLAKVDGSIVVALGGGVAMFRIANGGQISQDVEGGDLALLFTSDRQTSSRDRQAILERLV